MPHKNYSPDMNVPSVPVNVNGVEYWGFDWVNVTRDLDSLLFFLVYNIVKNNCALGIPLKFCFWLFVILSELISTFLENKSDLNKVKVSLLHKEKK